MIVKYSLIKRRAMTIIVGYLVFFSSIVSGASVIPDGFHVFSSKKDITSMGFVGGGYQSIKMKSFLGNTVVLNLWATWCPSCIDEMPSLMRLSEKLEDKGVIVAYINQDKGGMAVSKEFYKRLGMEDKHQYFDPSGSLSRGLGIRGLPTTFIVDSDGYAIAKVEGPVVWDSDSIIQYILSIDES